MEVYSKGVLLFVAEQKIDDFSFPPKMLKQGVFINFGAGHQRGIDVTSKKLES
jgi:hypothetical protein